jgi:hypothetical protein
MRPTKTERRTVNLQGEAASPPGVVLQFSTNFLAIADLDRQEPHIFIQPLEIAVTLQRDRRAISDE